jgi:Ca2+-binding RTX toxin-like protein
MHGGDGDDVIYGGAAPGRFQHPTFDGDTLYGDADADDLHGAAGRLPHGGADNDSLCGGTENDVLRRR